MKSMDKYQSYEQSRVRFYDITKKILIIFMKSSDKETEVY